MRDYIHVVDLAPGHLVALHLQAQAELLTCNLGTGRSYSVLDVIAAFERVTGRRIPYDIVERRSGASPFAMPSKP